MQHLIQTLESRRLMSASFIDEPITGFADVAKNYEVAYLPNLDIGHVAQLHGSINWGDGTTSPANFWRDKNGGIDIVAIHSYTKPGTFAVSSSLITETPWAVPGQPVPDYILDLGAVSTSATIAATPAKLTKSAGQSFSATMGSFQYLIGVTYTAKIDWGDGVTTTATITNENPLSTSLITGTHLYAHGGTYIAHAYLYITPVVPHPPDPSLLNEFTTLVEVNQPTTA
jgi:hypothetical protein